MAGRPISGMSRRYVRARALAHMDSSVIIYRPTDPVLNENTGIVSANLNPVTVYTGRARIYSVEGGGVVSVGEADLSTRVTYISIPVDVDPVPHVDDVVVVTNSPSDPDLVARAMRIVDVEGGGLIRATRRMRVTMLTENRSWDQ